MAVYLLRGLFCLNLVGQRNCCVLPPPPMTASEHREGCGATVLLCRARFPLPFVLKFLSPTNFFRESSFNKELTIIF